MAKARSVEQGVLSDAVLAKAARKELKGMYDEAGKYLDESALRAQVSQEAQRNIIVNEGEKLFECVGVVEVMQEIGLPNLDGSDFRLWLEQAKNACVRGFTNLCTTHGGVVETGLKSDWRLAKMTMYSTVVNLLSAYK